MYTQVRLSEDSQKIKLAHSSEVSVENYSSHYGLNGGNGTIIKLYEKVRAY